MEFRDRHDSLYDPVAVVVIIRPPDAATTTLSASIGAADDVIPLRDASGFPPSGAAVVGEEVVQYTSLSGQSLQGAVRGVAGTSAEAHPKGTEVSERRMAVWQGSDVASPFVLRRSSVGVYYALYKPDEGGRHFYAVRGISADGLMDAQTDGYFDVRHSPSFND